MHPIARAWLVITTFAIMMTPTAAWAIPVAVVAGITGLTGFAAAAATFILNAAISPAAMIIGEQQVGGITSRPPRLPSITPIGHGKPSIGPFIIGLTTGDCMMPLLADRQYLLIDKRLSIRRGDLVAMKIKGGHLAGSIITKRFVEAFGGPEGAVVSVAQSYPPLRLDFGLDEIEWAHRVRAISPTIVGIFCRMVQATLRPRSLNERLAARH